MKNWDLKNTLIAILVLIYGVMIAIMVTQSNTIKDHERNVNAYQTELTQLRTQNDELISFNNSYKLKIDELDAELGVSKQEIKDIQKVLDDKVSYIAFIESQVRVDSILVPSTVIKTDSIKEIHWAWQDDWISINGKSDWKYTWINNLDVKVPLVVGLTDDYKIFAKSDNPHVQITSLEGSEIDRNVFQRKWDIKWSLQVGLGLNYGIINKTLDMGPYAGWGFTLTF
jgi:hypothetical protein